MVLQNCTKIQTASFWSAESTKGTQPGPRIFIAADDTVRSGIYLQRNDDDVRAGRASFLFLLLASSIPLDPR